MLIDPQVFATRGISVLSNRNRAIPGESVHIVNDLNHSSLIELHSLVFKLSEFFLLMIVDQKLVFELLAIWVREEAIRTSLCPCQFKLHS